MDRTQTASERLIVPMTPAEKRALQRRAGKARLTMAEFARRAVLDYDPARAENTLESELVALLATHARTFDEMMQQFTRTDAALERLEAQVAARAAAK